jgi:hypothetical protein
MMCVATANWTLFTDIPSPAQYVMLNSTIGCIFAEWKQPIAVHVGYPLSTLAFYGDGA